MGGYTIFIIAAALSSGVSAFAAAPAAVRGTETSKKTDIHKQ